MTIQEREIARIKSKIRVLRGQLEDIYIEKDILEQRRVRLCSEIEELHNELEEREEGK